MEQPTEAERRPFGVVLLTLLLLAYSALSIPFVLDAPRVTGAGIVRLFGEPEAQTAAHIVLAIVAAVAALGLWLRGRWGWVAAMLLAGPTLAVEVVLYFRGEPSFTYMAVATLIALYLNSADVRRRFFEPDDADPRRSGPDVKRVPA